jgi:hypothetical protein
MTPDGTKSSAALLGPGANSNTLFIKYRKEITEMKQKILRLGVLTLVLAVLLMGVMPATAAHKTTFTCTETWYADVDPGVWTLLPNGNVHIRGMVLILNEYASDSRLSGLNTVVLNANWDANLTGPAWGTFKIMNEDGGWEGHWEGEMTEQGGIHHATGDGFGSYDGMKVWWYVNLDECYGEFLEH